jgi:hypothetical protein
MQGMNDEHEAALKRDLVLIRELLALPSVEKHETRFEGEVALVAPGSDLGEVCPVIERYLSAAVKPPDQSLPPELEDSPLVEAMGGVRGGQTLYLKQVGGGISLYVALWPWSGGQRVTIKIGVHVQAT